MQFTIEKDVFLKGLSRIQGIVERKNTIPILANVLIESDDNGVYLTATDLEVGMKAFYPALTKNKGKITVSAKKLYEIIKELPEKEILFTTKENCWIEIRCDKSLFNIVGLSSEEFPYFPYPQQENFIKIKSNLLREMIDKTYFSISNDETKYNLNGIYFKFSSPDMLSLIATDGHRLSMITRKIAFIDESYQDKGVIFPKKGIYELKKISEEDDSEIYLGFMDNNAFVKKEKTIIVMRLVDGDFPDYTRVIPKNNDKVVILNRNNFFYSLRRMSILSNEKSKGVKISLKQNLVEISSSNPDFGDSQEEIEVSYTGPELSIGYNSKYIMDVLQNQDIDNIELHVKDNLSPGLLKPANDDNYLAVIMPMRL